MKKDQHQLKSKRILPDIWIFRNPLKKRVISFITLVVLAFFANIWVGYLLFGRHESCDNWHPNMTREEKILTALEWANRSNLLVFEKFDSLTGKTYKNNERPIPFDDYKSILKNQPDCCHVYERFSALTDHPSEELPEGDEGIVMLQYVGRYGLLPDQVYTGRVYRYDDLNDCKD